MLFFFIVNAHCFIIFEKNFNFCPVGLDVQSTYTPYYIGAKKISNNANSLESAQASQVLVNSYKLTFEKKIYTSHQCYVKSPSENVLRKLVSCSTQVNIEFYYYCKHANKVHVKSFLNICSVCFKMKRESHEFHMQNALWK